MNGSPFGKFNRDDLVRVLENAGFAALAAGLGYLASNIGGIEVSGTAAVFIPVAASVLATLQKYFTDTRV